MEHREAVEKDLLIRTGHCLDDLGRTMSWDALGAFLRRPDLNGEIAKEVEPDIAMWATLAKTNIIIADIYDMLAMINANICALGTGERAKKPKSYPRPGDKDKQRIGRNALPISEFKQWLDNKRTSKKGVNVSHD